VNSTKPLPKGLIYELLPNTEATLPRLLQRRRFPAFLLDRLNRDASSPLQRLVQTPTTPEGIIKDNSILRMLENSLTDGLLYRLRYRASSEGSDAMIEALHSFWRAVSRVFEDAWALPPKRSRLMHGAGIISLGLMMDAISERRRPGGVPSTRQFVDDLVP